jgi:pimeloyl-ACP methyl ester carboxylesterase
MANNPINNTDPSGHRECEVNRRGGCTQHILILACGKGLGNNCEGDYTDYGGTKPLSGYEKWAKENGYKTVYFGADSYMSGITHDLLRYVNAISNYMSGHPDDQFMLVGHSLGASAVIGAASKFNETESELAPSQISGVIALDANINSGIEGINDKQSDIDTLSRHGIQVSSYNSLAYKGLSLTPGLGYNLPYGSQTVFSARSHFDLATGTSTSDLLNINAADWVPFRSDWRFLPPWVK